MLKYLCVILHLGPTMLPKAFVVLAINALLAETYVLQATDHHKTCHATKWRSHGWEKESKRTPTGVQYPLIILNHIFESFAYKHGAPAAAKHFNKYDNSL